MDKKILGGLILLLLLATFVIAGIIEINPPLPGAAIPVVGGQSIVYYLKMINANLIAGPTVATPTASGTIPGTPVNSKKIDQTNSCAAENPATTCPVGLKAKLSKNLTTDTKNGVMVFKASLPTSGGPNGYIGQWFSIDLSSLDITQRKGFVTSTSLHSNYIFTLSAISSNNRYLFFEVKKATDGKILDCQNIFDAGTIANDFKSSWETVKASGWSSLWLTVPVYGSLFFNASTSGSPTGYMDELFSRLLKIDLSVTNPSPISCTNKEKELIDSLRAADLKVNIVGYDDVKKNGDPLVIYFTLDVLKGENDDLYYPTLPASAGELFK